MQEEKLISTTTKTVQKRVLLVGIRNRGVQRHPRRRKMGHRNPRGKIRKLGTKFQFGQLILEKINQIKLNQIY